MSIGQWRYLTCSVKQCYVYHSSRGKTYWKKEIENYVLNGHFLRKEGSNGDNFNIIIKINTKQELTISIYYSILQNSNLSLLSLLIIIIIVVVVVVYKAASRDKKIQNP